MFPQYPEAFHELDRQDIAAQETVLETGKQHWPAIRVMKTMRGWIFPYLKSRLLPGGIQPIHVKPLQDAGIQRALRLARGPRDELARETGHERLLGS